MTVSIDQRCSDPVETLINKVTSLVETRRKILEYSISDFKHYSFYGINTKIDREFKQLEKISFFREQLPRRKHEYKVSSSATNSDSARSEKLLSFSSELNSSFNDYLKSLCPINESMLTSLPANLKQINTSASSLTSVDLSKLVSEKNRFQSVSESLSSTNHSLDKIVLKKKTKMIQRENSKRKVQILNNHDLKPSKRITSYEDELDNRFERINFNNINPCTYDFAKWKALIKNLKSRKDLYYYALSKNVSGFKMLNDLVEFIQNSPAGNELERVWVIFLWITEHITYDEESYLKGECDYNEPEDVLLHGRCTCEGFAMMFKYLCNRLDIECIRISGYSKGTFFDWSKELKRTDHSWNAVKVGGRWELVDCTWGVGYVKQNEFMEDSWEFIKKLQPFYFLTPPQFFIYDHFSEDYQLQPEKISLEEFRMLPKFEVFFHMFEIECVSHRKVDIVTKKGRVNLRFKCPQKTEIVAKLKDSFGVNYNDSVYYGRNPLTNQYEVKVAVPKTKQKFTLILYGKYSQNTDDYKEVARYFITFNTNEKIKNKKLIRNSSALKNGFIFQPMFADLHKGSIYQFKIYYKNATSIALIDSNWKWTYLKKDTCDQNIWCLNYMAVKIGIIYLAVKQKNKQEFEEMCSYNVNKIN